MGVPNEEKVISGFSALCGRYGYSQYRMNKFESYDLYVANRDFLVSDSVITFTDTDGRLMALKPDVTLSIIKNGRDTENGIQKVYYNENVYRVSKRTRAFREITQVGLEAVGAVDDYTIFEVLMLACESLRLISEDYVLDISQLDIVRKTVDMLGVSAENGAEIVKCIGEKNASGVRELCTAFSADEEAASMLCALVSAGRDPEETVAKIRSFPKSAALDTEISQLESIIELLESSGYKGHAAIDFSVMNDMNYYGGIAFCGFVRGLPSGILSGGRYDRLMRKMGRNCGAVGFALYLDMLELLQTPKTGPDTDILLLYGENDSPVKIRDAVAMLTASGSRVLAAKKIPEKFAFRQLLRLTESGVEILG